MVPEEESIMAGRYGGRNRKLRDHISITPRKQREKAQNEPINPQNPSLVMYFLFKAASTRGSIASPNSTANWGPSF